MAESLNRKIARRYSKAVTLDNFKSDGTLVATARVYDSTVDLPTSGIAVGAQGYVSSNQRLYIRGTGGWYNVATINNTPTINSVQTAGGDSSPFTLAIDGTTTTVITINATDSEGFPITFSAVTDVGFDSIATVSQDSSVFTITPFGEDSAGTATSGTLTFKATDGVNIASEVATFTLTFKVENCNFTTLLLKASGNNGTNVNIDDASNNHTIAVNGNAVAQSFTPHHPGGYSTYFDGNGDYLQAASSSDFAFGSNNFTIEFWAYPRTISIAAILDPRTTDNQAVPWIGLRDTGYFYYYVSGNNRIEGATGSVTTDKWYHVAVSRSSGTTKMFVNGIQIGSDYSDSTPYVQGGPWRTGTRYNGTTLPYHGYIRDFRCINGTALYTTNFTPPTQPLTAVTNTKLLHSHLPYIDDGSTAVASNRKVITVSGNTGTQRIGPYDHLRYSASTHGASVYFDGNGDKLTTTADTQLAADNGSFTLETWIYPTADTNYPMIATMGTNGANHNFAFYWHPTTKRLMFEAGGGNWSSTVYTTNTDYGFVKFNQWQHVAVVYDTSNNLTIYRNGRIAFYQASANVPTGHSGTFNIGTYMDTNDYPITGFHSDFRISQTAIYTNNTTFIPPTAPLNSSSDTGLLTCNDQPNIFNAAGITNPVKLNGDAKSSTTQKKNASASMYFDGTGDYISFSDDASAHFSTLEMGSKDFTIEAWVYVNAHKNTNYIYSYSYPYQFTIDANGHLESYFNNTDNFSTYITVQGSTSISTSTWTHVAVVRNAGTFTQFVNGVQDGTTTSTETLAVPSNAGYNPRIGDWGAGSYSFNGYLEDIRITKGLSRYPFIPAKETLTAISGTDLLVAHAATITNGSSNSIAVTANGDAAVSSFAPKFGMYSVVFDGAGDYLKTASSSNLNLYNTNFTIEGWFYATAPAGNEHIWSSYIDASNRESIYFTNSTTLNWYVNGSNRISATVAANTWHHVAIVDNSGTTTMFIDGASRGTWSSTYTDGNRLAWIGTYNDGGVASDSFTGYISNLRLLRGTARYTNSFTPPTAELTA